MGSRGRAGVKWVRIRWSLVAVGGWFCRFWDVEMGFRCVVVAVRERESPSSAPIHHILTVEARKSILYLISMSRLLPVTMFFARSGRAIRLHCLLVARVVKVVPRARKERGEGGFIFLDIPGWPFLVQLAGLSGRCWVYLRGRYLHILKDK